MPMECGTKLICVVKCDFCNFDEVQLKRKDELNDVYELPMLLNFQKKVLDFYLINWKHENLYFHQNHNSNFWYLKFGMIG
jgi:uncharacterized Fe-S cluster-containing radical SAM superfamily enzyme